MKNQSLQMLAILCIFSVVLITIIPLNTSQANSYLTHVTVYVTTIVHDDGSTTTFISSVDKNYGHHSFQGSHQHESPSVDFEYDAHECQQCFDVG